MTVAITPGPWRIGYSSFSGGNFLEVAPPKSSDNRGCAVARCYGQDAEANAKAIAAVPAMVEALLAARGWLEEVGNPEDVVTIDAALKLAGVEV